MKSLFSLILVCILTFYVDTLKSQYNFQANDSLKGFNEEEFIKHSTSHGLIGSQLKLELQIAKREFIFLNILKGVVLIIFLNQQQQQLFSRLVQIWILKPAHYLAGLDQLAQIQTQ